MLAASPARAHIPEDCLHNNATMEMYVAAKKGKVEEFETAPYGGIRDQIREAQAGDWKTPNMDPETGLDMRGMALEALDGFTWSYLKLDLRHVAAFAEFLRCISK